MSAGNEARALADEHDQPVTTRTGDGKNGSVPDAYRVDGSFFAVGPPCAHTRFQGASDMTDATIAREVRAFSQSMAAQPPNQTMEVFLREQEALATVTPEGVIAAGTRLPDAALLDPFGAPTTLAAAVGDRRAVLVFYRGAWCPYCNIALGSYQAHLVPELDRRGVPLVAVSPQTPDGSLTMKEKHDLGFAVLSDPGNVLARRAGILTAPSEEVRAAQLELGLDLEVVNADGSTSIPMASTLILDPDLTVRWIDVHSDYSTRTEPGEILTGLDALAGSGPTG
jgi:peroxiredoxin